MKSATATVHSLKAARRDRKREFDGAKTDRLTGSWSGSGDINTQIGGSLSILRNRARELEQNHPHVRKFLGLVEANVVGHKGFTLNVRGELTSGKPDTQGNKLVERAFVDWCEPGVCEVSGGMSFAKVCRLLARTGARDGESMLRMHDVAPSPTNPVGFMVEVLDVRRLDHRLMRKRSRSQNAITMGVETNLAGRVVAYHLLTTRFGSQKHERVDAADLLLNFSKETPEQLRGYTGLNSIMLLARQLNGYREAAMVASRSGANKMGFYKTKDGATPHAVADSKDDSTGELLDHAQPGHFQELPEDIEFQSYDPAYPHSQYEMFMREANQAFATGLGVAYHALTGDLTDVNFSSIRQGTLDERDGWMIRQDDFSSMILRRLYPRWLSAAAVNGVLGSRISVANAISRYRRHDWQGRRWQWVDPMKDMQTALMGMGSGLKAPQQYGSEMGVDTMQSLEQISEFMKKAKDLSVLLQWGKSGNLEPTDKAKNDDKSNNQTEGGDDEKD